MLLQSPLESEGSSEGADFNVVGLLKGVWMMWICWKGVHKYTVCKLCGGYAE